MGRTILLGLNEINFDYVRRYVERGHLPGFRDLMGEHGLIRTQAEDRYERLEPWIQWVTVHTGRPYEDHGVFRLGDIVGQPVPQFFEDLEQQGFQVGAISPMNAENRLRSSPYFVPDPWTGTPASGAPLVRRLAGAVAKAVNTNATGGAGTRTLLDVLVGLLRYARPRHYPAYAHLIACGLRRQWPRAMLLDLLLYDLHTVLYRKHQPDLSVLFLNAGAHIQHHYFFNSSVGETGRRNPDWYVAAEADPVLEVYALYDRMLRDLRARFPQARLILATGLQQVPYPEVTFYYRLTDHAEFLRQLGIDGVVAVEPRMSRDFLVRFADAEAAWAGERVLRGACDEEGRALFEEVDNRGAELFVSLTYPHEVRPGTRAVSATGRVISDLAAHVALVAIKNGHHDTTGYLIDTAEQSAEARKVPLASLHERVMRAVQGPGGDSLRGSDRTRASAPDVAESV
ncbi:alkaline phosphatase family protein [Thioalkalivibrio sp. ALE9]|uniref:alkaline phosphatase family protein n=1 Tax=Thioalkalivibrio sp. ALE9 TaxID=1158169 RepID=UPI00035D4C47|nr:alkaline phosphatase family protein [Thioalkalivibrio sp. ALE9]